VTVLVPWYELEVAEATRTRSHVLCRSVLDAVLNLLEAFFLKRRHAQLLIDLGEIRCLGLEPLEKAVVLGVLSQEGIVGIRCLEHLMVRRRDLHTRYGHPRKSFESVLAFCDL